MRVGLGCHYLHSCIYVLLRCCFMKFAPCQPWHCTALHTRLPCGTQPLGPSLAQMGATKAERMPGAVTPR